MPPVGPIVPMPPIRIICKPIVTETTGLFDLAIMVGRVNVTQNRTVDFDVDGFIQVISKGDGAGHIKTVAAITAPDGGVCLSIGFDILLADGNIDGGGKLQIAFGADGGIFSHSLSDETAVTQNQGGGGGDGVLAIVFHADIVFGIRFTE